MDAAAILARFDAEMRADPAPEAGLDHVWVDGVLRTLGSYDFIGWWDFPAARLDEIVARESAFLRERGVPAEWKVFSHDRPPGLEAALQAAGWADDGAETLLVLDLDNAAGIDAPPPPGVQVRRVGDMAGIDDSLAVDALAFGRAEPWRRAALELRLQASSLDLYVAYAGGQPISSGRLEMADGRAFAGLYGGGTAPEHRGRGVYRAMVAARADEARRRGVRYLTVDARETSRPILERLGFIPLATIRGWTLNQAE